MIWRAISSPRTTFIQKMSSVMKTFGASIGENTVHGSDKPESAVREVAYFFSAEEIVG